MTSNESPPGNQVAKGGTAVERHAKATAAHLSRMLAQLPANGNAPPETARKAVGIALAVGAGMMLAGAGWLAVDATARGAAVSIPTVTITCFMAMKLLRACERLLLPTSFYLRANPHVIRAATGQGPRRQLSGSARTATRPPRRRLPSR